MFSNPSSKIKKSSQITGNPKANFPWTSFLLNMVKKVQYLVLYMQTSLLFGQLYKQLKMLILKVHLLHLSAILKNKSDKSSQ